MNIERVAAEPSRKEPQRPETIIWWKLAKRVSNSLVARAQASAHEDKVGKLQLLQMAGNFLEIVLAQLSPQHRKQSSKAVRDRKSGSASSAICRSLRRTSTNMVMTSIERLSNVSGESRNKPK